MILFHTKPIFVHCRLAVLTHLGKERQSELHVHLHNRIIRALLFKFIKIEFTVCMCIKTYCVIGLQTLGNLPISTACQQQQKPVPEVFFVDDSLARCHRADGLNIKQRRR